MQSINLQIAPGAVNPVINVSQNDVGRQFQLKLYDGAAAYTLPTGTTASIEGIKPDGHAFSYSDAVSVSGSILTVTTKLQMTVVAGRVICEIRLRKSGLDLGSLNFVMLVEESPINENVDPSDTEIPAIIELAEGQVEDAEAWARGTKNGEPVPSTDPQFQNNAKWYAEHVAASLDALSNVNISSPVNEDILEYNSTTHKWKNSGAVRQLKQALSNLRDELGAHNILSIPDDFSYTVGSGGGEVFGTSPGTKIAPIASGDYTFSFNFTASAQAILRFHDSTGTQIYQSSAFAISNGRNKVDFTLSSEAAYIRLYINSGGTVTKTMISLEEDDVTEPQPYFKPNTELTKDTEGLIENVENMGALNLSNNTAASTTMFNGSLTVTRNADKTYTLNGNSTGATDLEYYPISEYFEVEQGETYTISSGLANDSGNTQRLWVDGTPFPSGYRLVSDAIEASGTRNTQVAQSTGTVRVVLYIYPNQTYSNVKIKPMVIKGKSKIFDYAPYAMSNDDLTKALESTDETTLLKYHKTGGIVTVQTAGAQTYGDLKNLTIPSGFRPKTNVTLLAYVNAGSTRHLGLINAVTSGAMAFGKIVSDAYTTLSDSDTVEVSGCYWSGL